MHWYNVLIIFTHPVKLDNSILFLKQLPLYLSPNRTVLFIKNFKNKFLFLLLFLFTKLKTTPMDLNLFLFNLFNSMRENVKLVI